MLPPQQLDQLHALVAAVRHRALVLHDWGFAERSTRGLGTTALFTGPSGTGKTLAAEVIAHELGLDLVVIDLSQVVSKYIGETEKHLRRVFDAAEDGAAVLLFDEADTLFGKRSEVRDSHDRYANLEVGYLLQRMESFRGLAILTTNARSTLDQAFTRRLRTIVTFPLPRRGGPGSPVARGVSRTDTGARPRSRRACRGRPARRRHHRDRARRGLSRGRSGQPGRAAARADSNAMGTRENRPQLATRGTMTSGSERPRRVGDDDDVQS